MKLYFSPFSPYVRKCLVTAHELGLDQRIELLPCAAHPVQRDAKLVADNPLGKIPTFFSDDGLVLFDSRVICEYLNDLGQGSIFPPAGRARWEALTLHSLADGMLDAALLIRYELTARPQPGPEHTEDDLQQAQQRDLGRAEHPSGRNRHQAGHGQLHHARRSPARKDKSTVGA